MMKPRWSPEINFGHLLQAATLVVMVGGGAFASYLSLRADITGIEARLLVVESRRVEDKEFQRETRAKLDELLRSFTEMRIDLVQKQDRGR